jgi:serine/threonine protein kinase
MIETLTKAWRPLRASSELGEFRLEKQLEVTENSELWEASPKSNPDDKLRLKRYFIDDLLTGEAREQQRQLVHRDLEALTILRQQDGRPQLFGVPFPIDDSYVVVYPWPDGKSLETLMLEGAITPDEVQPIIYEVVSALAAVHKQGITHRNLRPSCLYIGRERVYITDFDYSRIPGKASLTAALRPDMLDLEFTAPEVGNDLSEASPRSDVYSVAAIISRVLVTLGIDSDDSIIPPHWSEVLASCQSVDKAKRPANAEELLLALADAPMRELSVDGLQVNDIIEFRFVVRQRADTTGGTSVVYRVYDRDLREEYAAKFVLPGASGDFDVFEEYRRLDSIPEHAGVVKPGFAFRSSIVVRGKQEYPFKAPFLLTAWVQGTSLADLISNDLPVVRTMQIGSAVAEILAHIHDAGVIHRDVKPENILLDERGNPVVIDFNVSGGADSSLKTKAGTPPYMPPEVVEDGGQWTAASDVYALGVCLAELIAGHRLGRSLAGDWVKSKWHPGKSLQELQSVLLTSLAADPNTRPNAAALAEALDSALKQFAETRDLTVQEPPPVYIKEGSNHNPYLDQLVGLFSQSTGSNAGTRGLDDFRRWLYVETRIDRALRPAVLSGSIQLLLITGNAGDGKTAFIRMLEQQLRTLGAKEDGSRGSNGSELRYGGTTFITNWDGSQDEGDKSNDDVLERFFEPFKGSSPPPPPEKRVAVIAINEGRLLDFLSDNSDKFAWLERELLDLLVGGPGTTSWISLVNLNQRALTVVHDDEAPLVGQLLARMSDQRLWEPCSTCAVKDNCYALSNARTLQDPVLGPRVAERIRQAMDLVRLRRRLHVTMRELVSALAYSVAGNRKCAEIVNLFGAQAVKEILGGYIYNALFAASDVDLLDTRGAQHDRLLQQLGSLDVAVRPIPEEDGRLWLRGPDALAVVGQKPSEPDRELLDDLWEVARDSGPDSRDWAGLRLAHSALRRKHYMEREDAAYLDMFPYEYLQSFMAALVKPPQDANRIISEAISHSEGLRAATGQGILAVRVVQDLGAEDRSFISYKADLFKLEVIGGGKDSNYIEFRPDRLLFHHKTIPSLELEIDVDLWEALMRMRSGFTPSREDLRGSWLSLQTFKEKIASTPSRELMIQPKSGPIHRVYADDSGSIVAAEVEA